MTRYNNNQEYAELKNQNNSFKFISWFEDWRKKKKEREKRVVYDLERRRKIKMKNTKQRIKVKEHFQLRRDPSKRPWWNTERCTEYFQNLKWIKFSMPFRRSSYAVVCYLNKLSAIYVEAPNRECDSVSIRLRINWIHLLLWCTKTLPPVK